MSNSNEKPDRMIEKACIEFTGIYSDAITKYKETRQAYLDSLRIKAEQDSIMAAQIAAEEEQKERNLWMIIGGVILAIAMFVGNQLAQTFRTRRTEKKMSDMAKHAEEAQKSEEASQSKQAEKAAKAAEKERLKQEPE